jgi:hypothetical protein
VSSFQEAFEKLGYSVCASVDLEKKVQKVVIFADANGSPTHAARQCEDGTWCSKLGRWFDIVHKAPEDVGGDAGVGYGHVAVVMRRQRG